ncbi:hypothetical protein C8J55DRAFT_493561 [Lentinula edodes]|uniref:DRBM domain-containing protein n=1 Tax=Lentinula lateritia TaxID=40482 RepID=A0A9W8ZS18_9AGAR|nr:hypothetical protein C8J55DRAFT_493561 [Lentinula edodes]
MYENFLSISFVVIAKGDSESSDMEGSHDHYKMRVNNYAQGAHLSFRIDSNPSGPNNAVVWLSVVYINDEEYGRGEGPNKRVAEENAANAAWWLIKSLGSVSR